MWEGMGYARIPASTVVYIIIMWKASQWPLSLLACWEKKGNIYSEKAYHHHVCVPWWPCEKIIYHLIISEEKWKHLIRKRKSISKHILWKHLSASHACLAASVLSSSVSSHLPKPVEEKAACLSLRGEGEGSEHIEKPARIVVMLLWESYLGSSCIVALPAVKPLSLPFLSYHFLPSYICEEKQWKSSTESGNMTEERKWNI